MTKEKLTQKNHPLIKRQLISQIEKLVSKYLGRTWKVNFIEDKTDLASHFCAILSDEYYSVFAKLSNTSNGRDQFECEVQELNFIKSHSDVKTPSIVGIITIKDLSILVLEGFQVVNKKSCHWYNIGQTLAKLHKVKSKYCGFNSHGYFGPLYQDNRPIADWVTFYIKRRILPYLKMAVDSGNLPLSKVPLVNKLVAKLPVLCGPEVEPSLLHGDAQQNNFISTRESTILIDPAVHFGNPEFDLALVDYFQPVPDEVFQGYETITPINPGFEKRRDLWRIAAWLACIVVDKSYLNNLTNALKKYL